MENDKQPLKPVSISQHLPKSNVPREIDFSKFFPKEPIAVEPKPVRVSDYLPKVKEPTTNVNVDEVPRNMVKVTFNPHTTITDAEWDELNRSHMAIAHASQRKKRPQKYNTTYCFNLSKAQLEALSTYAKFNNTSKSNCIRKAITEMLNKGRI
jgi:hypothetical protein